MKDKSERWKKLRRRRKKRKNNKEALVENEIENNEKKMSDE